MARDYGPSALIPDIQEDDVITIENPPDVVYTENPTYTLITNGSTREGVSMNTLI